MAMASGWQKCPICDGSGGTWDFAVPQVRFVACPTCKGKRIISTLTGLPPAAGAQPAESEER